MLISEKIGECVFENGYFLACFWYFVLKKVCFAEYSIYYENKNGTWEGHFGSDSIFLKSQKVQWDIKAGHVNHVP